LNQRTEEEYKETIASVLQDVKDLNLLTNTLLELTKLSDENLPNRFTSVRIDDILWEARTFLIKVHTEYVIGIEFAEEIDSEDQLSVMGNPQLLKVAFINLMENGCKFSLTNTVNVFIGYKNGIYLQFKNKGVAIDKKDQKLIFLPFFRSKNTAETKGYGIGLPLAERIVKLHRGQIAVEQSNEEQTIFRIQFSEAMANSSLALKVE
jgi:signal transduction histidine kinase